MNSRNNVRSYHEGDIVSLTLKIGIRVIGTYFRCDDFVGIDFRCPQRIRPERGIVASTYMPEDFKERVYVEDKNLVIAR